MESKVDDKHEIFRMYGIQELTLQVAIYDVSAASCSHRRQLTVAAAVPSRARRWKFAHKRGEGDGDQDNSGPAPSDQ